MRKGFIDIILLLVIIGLPIYIIVSMVNDHRESIITHIQDGGSILCTTEKTTKINANDEWILTNRSITINNRNIPLMSCEKIITKNNITKDN